MSTQSRPPVWLAIALLAIMALTRGSHVGTVFAIPDATLAAMLLGGIFLQRGVWFTAMLVTCVAVDAYAVGMAGVSSYCLSPAYWALLPTYASMWLGGRWLAKRGNAFAAIPYALIALAATTIAFVISTYSFFLFSGRFPRASLWEVMQHGWEYYPSYLGYTMMYLGLAWVVRYAARTPSVARQSRAA